MTPLASRLRDAGGSVPFAAFDALAAVRRRKPLHPRGLLVPAVVERSGGNRLLGAGWLDEPGRDEGVVRLSRSVGLPGGWPDVWGLALRVQAPGTPRAVADLLLSSAWAAPLGRNVLALRRAPREPFSCVLPYRTASGRRVLLAAIGGTRALPSGRTALEAALAAAPWQLTLAASTATGSWMPFATLTVGGAALGTADGRVAGNASDRDEVSFDPVLNPLPGLVLPQPLATVRARAYAGARRGRAADADTLAALPVPRA